MDEATKSLLANLVGLLKSELEGAGKELALDAKELAEYIVTRGQHLASLVGDPNFARALRAERDTIAIKAGIAAVAEADAIDQRVHRIVQGGLSLVATALIAL